MWQRGDGFSAPCIQCVHWMTSHSQTWPKMCLCELMNWFNCLPNLRAAKSNKLKFTILWSHLQGDNTATVYFVRCWSEAGENYSPCIILIIIIIVKILLIGNTDGCFAPLTCTIVSARLAADSAGQGVLIPRGLSWLHSPSHAQQLRAIKHSFGKRHGWRLCRARWCLTELVEPDTGCKHCGAHPLQLLAGGARLDVALKGRDPGGSPSNREVAHPAAGSREVGACQWGFVGEGGLKCGKTAVIDYFCFRIDDGCTNKLSSWVNGCVAESS